MTKNLHWERGEKGGRHEGDNSERMSGGLGVGVGEGERSSQMVLLVLIAGNGGGGC